MKFFERKDFLISGNTYSYIEAETAANIANRLLREWGEVVYGTAGDPFRDWKLVKLPGDTHKGLLICVEEIQKDSAEKVLRDLAECDWTSKSSMHLIQRAKKILGEK